MAFSLTDANFFILENYEVEGFLVLENRNRSSDLMAYSPSDIFQIANALFLIHYSEFFLQGFILAISLRKKRIEGNMTRIQEYQK